MMMPTIVSTPEPDHEIRQRCVLVCELVDEVGEIREIRFDPHTGNHYYTSYGVNGIRWYVSTTMLDLRREQPNLPFI